MIRRLMAAMAVILGCMVSLGCAAPPGAAKEGKDGALTSDTLLGYFEKMGYEIRNGDIVDTSRGFDVFINPSLSRDGSQVYFNVWFKREATKGDLPAGVMRDLLAANMKDAFWFAYDKDKARIFAVTAIPNEGLTPKSVRKRIEGLSLFVGNNEALWNDTKWERKPE